MTQTTNYPVEVWPLLKKMSMLFVGSYLFLYIFPFPLNELPYWGDVVPFYTKTTDTITIWVGKYLLGMQKLEKLDVGSGDTTFHYVDILATILLSIVMAGTILLFTRKQNNYTKLYEWLIAYTRYFIGVTLMMYGGAKLNDGGQFLFPTSRFMDMSIGNNTPSGLLWTFMGYSRSYCIFTGLSEIIGGVLLLFRRTTILGCLISVGVMAHVVVINFSYDVVVKLFSSHLLLFILIVFSPNIMKVVASLTRANRFKLVGPVVTWPKKWMKPAFMVLKLAILLALPFFSTLEGLQHFEDNYRSHYGLEATYKTRTFVLNGDTLPPLTTDSVRWEKVIIEHNYANFLAMDKRSNYYCKVKADTTQKIMYLSDYFDSTKQYIFTYRYGLKDSFFMSGIIDSDTIAASFRQIKAKDYPLASSGFHWIIE